MRQGRSAEASHDFLKEAAQQVRRLELRTRGLVESLFVGEYRSVFKGRGLELADVREYQPGDDVRAIDWNVTARRGRPYVKEYVEERELTALLVVDLSASERFGTGRASNQRIACEIAAVLALAAAASNDHVGLVIVTDRVERFVPPDSGRRHALRLVLELLAHRPRGRGTRLSGALEHASRVLRRRSAVFLVSDFLTGPRADPGLAGAARRLAREHDLVAVRLTDPGGALLPDVGLLALADPETGRREVVDTSDPRMRERWAALHEARRSEVSGLFAGTGMNLVEVSTTDDYVPPLIDFFRRRAQGSR